MSTTSNTKKSARSFTKYHANVAATHSSGRQGEHFTQGKQEHEKECEKETATRLARTQKDKALQENLKSAISDHRKRNNHVMDWNGARIIRTDDNKHRRWIKEAMEIRRRVERAVKRHEGVFILSHIWDSLLQKN